MLPTPAAQEHFARLLRGKLSGEARKCIFGSTYETIGELKEKLKRVYVLRTTTTDQINIKR